MNTKSDFKKYKRLTRILRVVMKIFYGVSLGIAISALIALVVIQFVPNAGGLLQDADHTSISLSLEGMVNYRFDPQAASPQGLEMIMKTIFLVIAAVAAIIAPIFYQVAAILKNVEGDRPFDISNSKRLTIIGTMLIAGSFIIRLAEYFVIWSVINTFKLDLFTLNYSYDGTMMVMGFLMYILAGVFRYGNHLQQEYDETV